MKSLCERSIFGNILHGDLAWARVTDNDSETFAAQAHDGLNIIATVTRDRERKGPKIWYRVDTLPYGKLTKTVSTWHSDPIVAYQKMKKAASNLFWHTYQEIERRRGPGGEVERPGHYGLTVFQHHQINRGT